MTKVYIVLDSKLEKIWTCCIDANDPSIDMHSSNVLLRSSKSQKVNVSHTFSKLIVEEVCPLIGHYGRYINVLGAWKNQTCDISNFHTTHVIAEKFSSIINI